MESNNEITNVCKEWSTCSRARSDEKLNEINSSYRLHVSQSSSMSSENDLSLSISQDVSVLTNRIIDSDELPAFEIRLISPLSRSPSPIDSDMDIDTPTRYNIAYRDDYASIDRLNNSDFVTLQDIDSQISLPSDYDQLHSQTKGLETIYEGVFLNTPPRPSPESRCNIIEKSMLNKMCCGKENAITTIQAKIPKNFAKSSVASPLRSDLTTFQN